MEKLRKFYHRCGSLGYALKCALAFILLTNPINQTLIFITLIERIKEELLMLMLIFGPTNCNRAKWFDNQESDYFVHGGSNFFFSFGKTHRIPSLTSLNFSKKQLHFHQLHVRATSFNNFNFTFFFFFNCFKANFPRSIDMTKNRSLFM